MNMPRVYFYRCDEPRNLQESSRSLKRQLRLQCVRMGDFKLRHNSLAEGLVKLG